MLSATSLEIFASVCFGLALIHTFCVHKFRQLSERYPEGSPAENFFHLMAEVEVVFGLWAAIFVSGYMLSGGAEPAIKYLESLNFTEPAFVFVILSVCSTRPILKSVSFLLEKLALLIPLPKPIAFYFVALVGGPLLGSFITEPAAMTVTALILLNRYYRHNLSPRLMYATIGLLFVNVSIGGTLTAYAAPPVLMVAGTWGWDTPFVFSQFGWRGALSCVLSTMITIAVFWNELARVKWEERRDDTPLPLWVVVLHLIFLVAIVVSAHHMVVFAGIFLFFLGLVRVTKEYQEQMKLREGLLVAFFLGGLVVLGGPQRWWLEPLLSSLEASALFFGATALTAFTDNAALTYLGAQVPNLADVSKYALVAGAVTGGGLTVVANAPNPAGFGILNPAFKDGGISPLKLFLGALGPTLVAVCFFWFI